MAFQSDSFQNDAFQISANEIVPDLIALTWATVSPSLSQGLIELIPTVIGATWSTITVSLSTGAESLTPSVIGLTWATVTPSIFNTDYIIDITPLSASWTVRTPIASLPVGSTLTFLSTTINGGTLESYNIVDTDILLSLTSPPSLETTVLFTYSYGGVIAGTISVQLHDGAVGLSEGTAVWLDFEIDGNGSSSSQATTASKYGDEAGSNNVLSTVSNTLSVDSDVDQTLEIVGVLSGDLSTILTKEYVIVNQLI